METSRENTYLTAMPGVLEALENSSDMIIKISDTHEIRARIEDISQKTHFDGCIGTIINVLKNGSDELSWSNAGFIVSFLNNSEIRAFIISQCNGRISDRDLRTIQRFCVENA